MSDDGSAVVSTLGHRTVLFLWPSFQDRSGKKKCNIVWLCRTVAYRYFCLNHPTTRIHRSLWKIQICNTKNLVITNKKEHLRLRTFGTRVRIPATGVRFFLHAPKNGGKISSTPAVTSTAPSNNYSGRGPATTTITDNIYRTSAYTEDERFLRSTSLLLVEITADPRCVHCFTVVQTFQQVTFWVSFLLFLWVAVDVYFELKLNFLLLSVDRRIDFCELLRNWLNSTAVLRFSELNLTLVLTRK